MKKKKKDSDVGPPSSGDLPPDLGASLLVIVLHLGFQVDSQMSERAVQIVLLPDVLGLAIWCPVHSFSSQNILSNPYLAKLVQKVLMM